ncbi:MAG TPA: phosphoribosylamine--glycine ligase [Bdellovibrionota bacterium]|jgi:phosphoribosylamine--glycine ligase
MNLLVIGGGGREHALAWKLAQGSGVNRVYLTPGNPGMAIDEKLECTGIAAGEFASIASLVKEKNISFVVVGPDQAMADGAVDFLEAKGIPTFGPTKEASRIEWSKAYSKDLMRSAGIPTAKYETFDTAVAARKFLTEVEWADGWVIKADGLALGKGVVVCSSREEALKTVDDFLAGSMGAAGKKIVVEERLIGREVSAFFLCDGEIGVPLGLACDYKRIFDNDEGPNTGGMGAFSPADWVEKDFVSRVGKEVTKPLLAAMKSRGSPFKGIVFIGLMVTEQGPKVLEFNARFGDPETQVLMPLIDEDLLLWLRAAREGKLSTMPPSGPKLKKVHGVHVVLAAAGYPGTPKKGDAIAIDPSLVSPASWERNSVKLFFAGVAKQGERLATNGGRVLGLTALAASREEARKKAYGELEKIKFSGAQRRTDVGR